MACREKAITDRRQPHIGELIRTSVLLGDPVDPHNLRHTSFLADEVPRFTQSAAARWQMGDLGSLVPNVVRAYRATEPSPACLVRNFSNRQQQTRRYSDQQN